MTREKILFQNAQWQVTNEGFYWRMGNEWLCGYTSPDVAGAFETNAPCYVSLLHYLRKPWCDRVLAVQAWLMFIRHRQPKQKIEPEILANTLDAAAEHDARARLWKVANAELFPEKANERFAVYDIADLASVHDRVDQLRAQEKAP